VTTNKLSFLEENEKLEQDRLRLKQCLKDIQAITYINEFTNKDTYIKVYKTLHSDLSEEEMNDRIEIINDIFHMVHNKID